MGIASTSQSGVQSPGGAYIGAQNRAPAARTLGNGSPIKVHRLVEAWNSTQAPYPEAATITSLFDAQAVRTPDATALIGESETVTFAELARRADTFAHVLSSSHHIGRGDRVAICAERSPNVIAALLGILKTGAAYVPIDRAFPSTRIKFMLEDSAPGVLVTENSFPEIRASFDGDTILIDEFSFGEDAPSLVSDARPEDPAYVAYTSGSTGRPKGVLGLHRGAINRFHWMWRTYPFADGEVCCQKTTLSFVDSVWEIFGPLLQGVPSVILSAEMIGNSAEFVRTLATHQVTRMVLVPSLLRILLDTMDDPANDWPTLKVCVTSGEAVSVDLCRDFQEKFPHAKLLNFYGSSEVSADITCYDTAHLPPDAETVPLGKPIANTEIHIVDEQFRPVGIGEEGEICAGGVGLGAGYLNQPELTEKAFVPDPFSDDPDAKLYRMGDLGRWLTDGTIEFRGRVDHQIKIRGVRIEPGDIESALKECPNVGDSHVRHLRKENGRDLLLAYITSSGASAPEQEDLLAHLRTRLPSFMMPNHVIVLDAFPLTVNGKLDVMALPEEPSPATVAESRTPPGTATEKALAKLWEASLGKTPTSIDTSFFALGGDSLGVTALAGAIDKLYRQRVPLKVLLETPTIRAAAAWLDHPENRREWSSIVQIRPEGTKAPLFLVHGIGGGVLWGYGNITEHLDPDRPVYAFSSRGLDGHEEFETPEEMASQYIRDMKSIQPEGPYLIGGYCFGGNIAYVMSRQLREAGEEVALCIVIDAYPFLSRNSGHKLRIGSPIQLFRFFGNFINKGLHLLRMPRKERREHVARIGRWLKWRLRGAKGNDARDEAATLTNLENYDENQASLWAAHVAMHRGFVDTPTHGLSLAVLRTNSQPVYSNYALDFGWSKLVGREHVRTVRVRGHHDFIFLDPNVAANAQLLDTALGRAETGRLSSHTHNNQ